MVSLFKDMIEKFNIFDDERGSDISISEAKDSMVDSLIMVQKIFTEFLFIKNIFEIEQDKTLKLDKEVFDLKSYIFYSLDTIMSLKKES